uniref:Uncharacterized protein n=1 Tax=Arundo donax TaxID=35708 RepID=A0A0A9D492_ARUDO
MLPRLHRLDPQVSKSKCLYNGKFKDLLRIPIVPVLISATNLSFCSTCGMDHCPLVVSYHLGLVESPHSLIVLNAITDRYT